MASTQILHPQQRIAEYPLSRLQVATIGICVLINMIDGFDVLAIAYTAPVIAEAWEIGPAELGMVFGAGGLGMMLGAVFLGPLADYKGRRFSVILGLAIITGGMLVTTLATSRTELILARVLTGIGIGGLLASLNTLVSEYASNKYRNISITLLHLGYPIGGAIGGLAAAGLINQFGWQSVFLTGALLSLALLPVCFWILPESIDFLLVSRHKDRLERINKIMRRLGCAALSVLPEPASADKNASLGLKRLWAPDLLWPNTLLPLAFFMLMFHLYFVLQWIPKLAVDLGHTVDQGIRISVLVSTTAAVGMFLFGLVSTRIPIRKVVTWLSCVASIAMLLFGVFSSSPYSLLLVFVALMGLTHSGLMPGLYAIAPRAYPASARAAGISMSIGIARLGAVLGPAFAGYLLANGVAPGALITLFAIPLIVPALVANLIPFIGQGLKGEH